MKSKSSIYFVVAVLLIVGSYMVAVFLLKAILPTVSVAAKTSIIFAMLVYIITLFTSGTLRNILIYGVDPALFILAGYLTFGRPGILLGPIFWAIPTVFVGWLRVAGDNKTKVATQVQPTATSVGPTITANIRAPDFGLGGAITDPLSGNTTHVGTAQAVDAQLRYLQLRETEAVTGARQVGVEELRAHRETLETLGGLLTAEQISQERFEQIMAQLYPIPTGGSPSDAADMQEAENVAADFIQD